MAISGGFSASNFIRCPSALVASAPLTLACWAKTSLVGAGQQILGIFAAGAAVNQHFFRIGLNPTNNINAFCADGGGPSSATATGSISADTWFHAAGVYSGPTSYSAFLNGGGKATQTTSRTPAGLDRTSIGVRDVDVSTDLIFASGGSGSIAEVGIWNAALNDDEVAALAKGIPPALIRPQSLVAYVPLVRDLLDLKGNAFAILGSLSAADHCRIMGLTA